MHTTLKIVFLSDWHISSGTGDGYLLDATLSRDGDGFPYIPGSTLRGAMRTEAHHLGLCRPDLREAENYFWSSRNCSRGRKGYGLRISSAHFSQAFKQQILAHGSRKQLIEDLTVVRCKTSLSSDGVVKTGSLNTMECGMPSLEFFATLEAAPSEGVSDVWIEKYFRAVCAMVKYIGAEMSRGLGRCRVVFSDHVDRVVLPPENSFLMKLGA